MYKYLVTSTMNALPCLHPVLKIFFVNFPNIAARGIHMTSLDGTSDPVLNIIVAIIFGYLPPIQFTLEKNVSWFPHKLIMQTDTATDKIIATAKDLTAALKKINKILYFHHLIPSHANHFSTQFYLFQCPF